MTAPFTTGHRHERAFQVLDKGLRCLSDVVEERHGSGDQAFEGIVRSVRDLRGTQRIRRRSPTSEQRRALAEQLRVEWANEVRLHAGALHNGLDAASALLGLGNDAATAAHGAANAVFIALAEPPKTDHTAIANSVANLVTQRSVLPFPWNIYLPFPEPFAERTSASGGHEAGPHGINVRGLRHGPLDPIRRLMVLAAAHRFRHRQRGRHSGSGQQSRGDRPATIATPYDAALCIREHLAYKTVDTLLTGPIDVTAARSFHETAVRQASAGLTALDALTAHIVGPSVYSEIMDRFLASITRLAGRHHSNGDALKPLLNRLEAITA